MVNGTRTHNASTRRNYTTIIASNQFYFHSRSRPSPSNSVLHIHPVGTYDAVADEDLKKSTTVNGSNSRGIGSVAVEDDEESVD
ncbi:hypothetical protein PILCRDRAFT_815425 [Piloderma croceum F 1598]|uniref:Uncharacterized protein n=1 Tax=Piloderma croceum (strain F 1598) TaxID=765440 RepID=A0A0C3G8K0_PILCF|nr:hypothetical protein PILCRDRAFT_815425 [Piloderma croceum F 1598]